MLRFIMVAFLTTFVATSPLLAQKTETKTETKAKKKKSPVLAFTLSLYPIFSGGQFYNGQYRKGLMLVGVQAAGMGLALQDLCLKGAACDSSPGGTLGMFLFWGGYLWSVIDAPISANRINKQNQQPDHGHLLEFDGNRVALGVDSVVWRNGSGARLTLHF